MSQADLARIILLLIGHPVSKVRLARLIYFAHKDLIRKKLLDPSNILYIRSPLGPIPDGYVTLADDSSDIIAQPNISSNLSYATEDYAVSEQALETEATLLEQYPNILKVVEKTLQILRPYTTPELIRISHNEPSWLAHHNGEIYQISPQDLKLTFPEQKPLHIKLNFIPVSDKSKTEINKLGAMQAHLLRGMIADIVKESTDLEYPDDPNSNTPPESSVRNAKNAENIRSIKDSKSLRNAKNPKTNAKKLLFPTIRIKITPLGKIKRPLQDKGKSTSDDKPLQNEGENRTDAEHTGLDESSRDAPSGDKNHE